MLQGNGKLAATVGFSNSILSSVYVLVVWIILESGFVVVVVGSAKSLLSFIFFLHKPQAFSGLQRQPLTVCSITTTDTGRGYRASSCRLHSTKFFFSSLSYVIKQQGYVSFSATTISQNTNTDAPPLKTLKAHTLSGKDVQRRIHRIGFRIIAKAFLVGPENRSSNDTRAHKRCDCISSLLFPFMASSRNSLTKRRPTHTSTHTVEKQIRMSSFNAPTRLVMMTYV